MTIVGTLENIIGEEKTSKLVNSRLYKFCVDAIAMNVFSLSYAINEQFIAGMSWEETGKARIATAIGNTITGRPYGIYRDYIMKLFHVSNESSRLKKYAVDVFVFATGQTPLYLCYLAAAGADLPQMIKGAAFLTIVAPLTGRPQGITYDYCRRQFGMNGTYNMKTEEKEWE